MSQLLYSVVLQGSDVNKPLLGGRNALHFAAEYGQQEVIEFLISKGADVNVSGCINRGYEFAYTRDSHYLL